MSFPCFAGCKCKSFFQIPQAFPNLFSENFFPSDSSFLPVFRWAPFAVAGAKVEPFFAYASFLSAFFWSFLKLFPISLITDSLQSVFFQRIIGFFCISIKLLHFEGFFEMGFWRFSALHVRFLKKNQSSGVKLLPLLIPQWRQGAKFCLLFLLETGALAPIGAEILLLFF